MDKIVLHLQNKEVINSLIERDPELKVAIKDAIVDSIVRRQVKFLGLEEVAKQVRTALNSEVKREFIEKCGSYKTQLVKTLREQIHKDIKDICKEVIATNGEELKRTLNERQDYWKGEIERVMSKYEQENNLDVRIRQIVEESIKSYMGKVFGGK